MSRDWEAIFRLWSKPSSDTEDQKCQNAERMIKNAIWEDEALKEHKIEIFAQGSYRNNTNVRQDSDVDICVRLMDVFFSDFSLANGFTKADTGIVNSTYSYNQFKNDIENALVAKFGRSSIKRGNKAFDVHENTYRVDADVVACLEHRRYSHRSSNGEYQYLSGTELRTDAGNRIVNWPNQNYENGVAKNIATGNRFKFVVRIIKRLRNEMANKGIEAAKPIPSYLIECLVWNAPNDSFGHTEYFSDVADVLKYGIDSTSNESGCSEWGEVNELKYLFRSSQPWTLKQTHDFLNEAWKYIESN